MSVKIMASVWSDTSIKSRSELLVLLALADFANDEGECWPSIDTLAMKARCSQRGVQTLISELISADKLSVEVNGSQHKTNIYKLLAWGVQDLHPATSRRKNQRNFQRNFQQPVAPDPSGTPMNHQEPLGEEVPAGAGSPHKKFIEDWCREYRKAFGEDYLFSGAKDGSAIKRLLSAKISPDAAIDLAKRAWANRREFNCKRATSIAGFVSAFNDIRVELNGRRAVSTDPDGGWKL